MNTRRIAWIGVLGVILWALASYFYSESAEQFVSDTGISKPAVWLQAYTGTNTRAYIAEAAMASKTPPTDLKTVAVDTCQVFGGFPPLRTWTEIRGDALLFELDSGSHKLQELLAPDGRFEFKSVEAGAKFLMAYWMVGGKQVFFATQDFVVREGETLELGYWRVPTAPVHDLTIRFTDRLSGEYLSLHDISFRDVLPFRLTLEATAEVPFAVQFTAFPPGLQLIGLNHAVMLALDPPRRSASSLRKGVGMDSEVLYWSLEPAAEGQICFEVLIDKES